MKIACIDKSASDRLELQRLVSEAFDSSREAIGHLAAIDFSPAIKEEILLGGLSSKSSSDCEWSGLVLGPKYTVEELFNVASELRAGSSTIPIFCFITPENFSIRILRRLERISVEVFRTDDSYVRIVHNLLRVISNPVGKGNGKLITFEGAKGGQGTSSLAVGIAHAAAAEGKSSIIVDLSKEGSLFHYLQAEKWQSSDYRTLLVDRLSPTKAIIDRLIVEAPNGIKLLLPPAGGSEIRELWIRSPQSFEITLSIIEFLKERFDLVLVDLAHSEGLLPFSLTARADIRTITTSNEPAAVHLLNDRLIELQELPSSTRTIVLLNMLVEHSLTSRDIEDYLLAQEAAASIELINIQYDAYGSSWIGTGNSIFTEGGPSIQSLLRNLAKALSEGTIVPPNYGPSERQKTAGFFKRLVFRNTNKKVVQQLLPSPEAGNASDVNFLLTDELKESFKSVSRLSRSATSSQSDLLEGYQSPTVSKVRATGG